MTQRSRRTVVALGLLWSGIGVMPLAWGASRAWLINEYGAATKLDLAQHRIIATTTIPTGKILLGEIAVDHARGHVFVPNGRGPYDVMVFDLKTLTLKGRLDFKVTEAPTSTPETIRFIFPPTGPVFFAKWWNAAPGSESGAFELATIDATTLRTVVRRTAIPPISDTLLLDATGLILYSVTSQKPAHVDVFTFPDLVHTSRVDLEPFVAANAFGRNIHDLNSGKVLFVENIKTLRGDPNRFSLFVVELAAGRITPKIHTGLEGHARLLPATSRILFDEEILLAPGAQMVTPGVELFSPGRIHVYDATTGNRLAIVTVPNVVTGEIIGVSPAENAFYYLSSTGSTSKPRLSIISLVSYSVVQDILFSIDDCKMIVFDE